MSEKEHEGIFWGAGNILFFDVRLVTFLYIYEKVKISVLCVFYFMYVMPWFSKKRFYFFLKKKPQPVVSRELVRDSKIYVEMRKIKKKKKPWYKNKM